MANSRATSKRPASPSSQLLSEMGASEASNSHGPKTKRQKMTAASGPASTTIRSEGGRLRSQRKLNPYTRARQNPLDLDASGMNDGVLHTRVRQTSRDRSQQQHTISPATGSERRALVLVGALQKRAQAGQEGSQARSLRNPGSAPSRSPSLGAEEKYRDRFPDRRSQTYGEGHGDKSGPVINPSHRLQKRKAVHDPSFPLSRKRRKIKEHSGAIRSLGSQSDAEQIPNFDGTDDASGIGDLLAPEDAQALIVQDGDSQEENDRTDRPVVDNGEHDNIEDEELERSDSGEESDSNEEEVDSHSGSEEESRTETLQRLRSRVQTLDSLAKRAKNDNAITTIAKVRQLFDEAFENLPSIENGDPEPASNTGTEIPERNLAKLEQHYQSVHKLLDSRHDKMPFIRYIGAQDVFPALVPALLKILKLLMSLRCLDEENEDYGVLPRPRRHLMLTIAIIKAILIEGAQSKSRRGGKVPAATGIRAVRRTFVPHLQEVVTELATILKACELDDKRVQQRSQQANAEAEERMQQEEASLRRAEEAHGRKVQAKWRYLHLERNRAQGWFTRSECAHLDLRGTSRDFDYNQRPFQRVQVFRERNGPDPQDVMAAKVQAWTDEQNMTLIDGLRQHHGTMVFERIIRAHCGLSGVLHQFNVTEIVTMAALVKECLTDAQEKLDGRVEGWVQAIPDWLKESELRPEQLRTSDT